MRRSPGALVHGLLLLHAVPRSRDILAAEYRTRVQLWFFHVSIVCSSQVICRALGIDAAVFTHPQCFPNSTLLTHTHTHL